MSGLSLGPDFADWCETHLVHSVDRWAGKPVVFEEWQREFFNEALRIKDRSTLEPVWRSVALIVPRKNGKTLSLAALAVYHLLTDMGQPRFCWLPRPTSRPAGCSTRACRSFAATLTWTTWCSGANTSARS